MLSINPFITQAQTPSFYFWQDLLDKKIYHFELILPRKGIIRKHKKQETFYLRVCAEAAADQKLQHDELFKGQKVMLEFPIITLRKAYDKRNQVFRNQLEDGDNVKMKFKKYNLQAMEILSIERLVPSEEHLKMAEEFYKQKPKTESKVVVRDKQEL